MADFEMRFQGLDEIERRLQTLPEKLRRKRLRKVLKDGTEIVRSEAAVRAPRRKPTPIMMAGYIIGFEPDAGPHLRDNITSKVSVTATKAEGKVGVDYKKVKHGHLVEFGTKPHKVGRFKHPGARKQPFMRPAFDAKSGESVEVIQTGLVQAVEQEV